jgi:hypothetical protein
MTTFLGGFVTEQQGLDKDLWNLNDDEKRSVCSVEVIKIFGNVGWRLYVNNLDYANAV